MQTQSTKSSLLTLNESGKQYAERVEDQLKKLNLYIPGDSEILLKDLGIQYQNYEKYLDMAGNSMDAKDTNTYLVISNRFFNNVINIQKNLGITVMNRAKLKVLESTTVEENNVLDTIETLLLED
jgi:hypothetical protein